MADEIILNASCDGFNSFVKTKVIKVITNWLLERCVNADVNVRSSVLWYMLENIRMKIHSWKMLSYFEVTALVPITIQLKNIRYHWSFWEIMA